MTGLVSGTIDDAYQAVSSVAEKIAKKYVGGFGLYAIHDGKPVVDIWAGERDRDGAPWQSDTSCVSFSTTKGAMSTLLHSALAENSISWDTPVVDLWRDAQAMQGVTVLDVMTHRAGYWNVQRLAGSVSELCDWGHMTRAICSKPPESPCSAKQSAYHALTYGHVAGGLYSAITSESVEEGFRKLAQTCGPIAIGQSDTNWGAQLRNLRRRAGNTAGGVKRTDASTSSVKSGAKKQTMLEKFMRSSLNPVDFSPLGLALELPGLRATQFSESPLVQAVIPAANGRFSARGLANLYAGWVPTSEQPWVGDNYQKEVRKIRVRGADYVLKIPMGWRAGFHGIMSTRGPIRGAFGHLGLGGSGGWVSPEKKLAVGFVTNGLESSLWGLRIARFNTAILQGLRA